MEQKSPSKESVISQGTAAPLLLSLVVSLILLMCFGFIFYDYQQKRLELQQTIQNFQNTFENKADKIQNELTKINEDIGELNVQDTQTKKEIEKLAKSVESSRSVYIRPEKPHSVHIVPNNPVNTPPQTVFGGIGIRFEQAEDGLYIREVMPNGPAQKSGALFSGDVIVEINGKTVKGMNQAEIMNNIRGQPGTSVMILYEPSGSVNTLKSVDIKREIIDVNQFK